MYRRYALRSKLILVRARTKGDAALTGVIPTGAPRSAVVAINGCADCAPPDAYRPRLVGAGLWQLTPLKTMCLRHSRSPLGFLIGNWRAGRLGALRMGLEHSAYCLECCWFLVGLLFFGGVMNLYWIVGLAVFILLEKIIPLGHWFGRVAGVVLIGAYLPMH
jgi:hypothetical protein